MNSLDRMYLNGKVWAMAKMAQFKEEERGDVNIVSMVVLIGIAVLLAVVFRGKVEELLETLFKTITQSATKAITD